jgi:predicted CoA-binding protein
MHIDGLDDAAIRAVLTQTRRIAVVGASANPQRASHGVTGLLIARGYDVTPVNPGLAGQSLLGRPVAARLDDATPLDMVDVFRAAAEVPPVIDDAIRLGARTVWLQLGIIHEAAAARARATGLVVVMDRCPALEFRRLGLPRPA